MAKQQRKEPWNSRVNKEEIHQQEGRAANRQKNEHQVGIASTVFLSILVFLMFAIIGGAIFFTIWNNRNPNMNTVASNFYPAAGKSSSSSTASSSAASTSSSSSADTSSSSSSAANTYTYPGDVTDVASIEKEAGVSWATLAKYNSQLNPNWGQPGDTLGPMKDGSYLQGGTVLKTGK